MKKIFIILLIVFGLVSVWQNSKAEELSEYHLNIDKNTVLKGYTAQSYDQKLKIGFLPNTFYAETQLKIVNLGQANFIVPDNLKLVSDIYLYDFSTAPKRLLNITLNHNSFSGSQRNFYFWDNNHKTWRILPTTELGNQTVAGLSPFKYARLAVFENKITNEEELYDVITAKSAIVMDAKTGKVLFEKNSKVQRPIASLTKIMTALVFLNHNPGWDNIYEFLKEDDTVPAKIYVEPGDTLKVTDLFYSMLVKSANNAATTLVRITGLYPKSYFIWLMNLKTHELGLTQTQFVDSTGLDERNVSTAYDYALLSKYALKNSDIPKATTAATYSFKTKKNEQSIDLVNTTTLFGGDLNITMTKTGFTYEAGPCLMTAAKNFNTGEELIAVVLNSKSGYLSSDVYTLLDYYLNQ